MVIELTLPTVGELQSIADKLTAIATPSRPTRLVISPISAKKTKPARLNYDDLKLREMEGESLLWDDSRFNQSEVGDLFGFHMHAEHVIIHTIVGVFLPSERIPSWSLNVGHGSRNVIQLSEKCVTVEMDVWRELGGMRTCRGTTPVKKALDAIIGYHQSKMSQK